MKVVPIKTQETICTKCRHYLHIVENPAAPQVWYNHRCGAVSREVGIDLVTGVKGYRETNSLGMGYVTDQQHPYCRDVNNGSCPHFSLRSN